MMDYDQTLDWLFKRLPMYQNLGSVAYKKDLSNIRILMDFLKNPESQMQIIHVAGTNGKGSTCHMLSSILQEEGYRVGLYTSPHLVDFRERIKINGRKIDEAYIVDFISKNKAFFEGNFLSFFEMTLGIAFQYFSDSKVDYVILECGLGGCLDSTNIVFPIVSVITNIGLDHTDILGTTFREISLQKAGIIKEGIPVVLGEYHEETYEVFERIASEKKSELHKSFEWEGPSYETDLKGIYQEKNIKTVLKTIEVLQKLGVKISKKSIREGLLKVVSHTGFFGRYQTLSENPKVICDVAHNREGLSILLSQLLSEDYEQLHIVFGLVEGKDLKIILPLLPKTARYYFTKPRIERALSEEKLQEAAKLYGLYGACYPLVMDAKEDALKYSNSKDLIYIGGSTFVVADAMSSMECKS